MGSVNGRVALITGGANGIGEEVARRLHAKGARLVLTDLDEGRLKEVAAKLGEDRVQACGEAFVKGIEGRKRQINCPGWVGLFRWLRPILTTSWGEGALLKGLQERVTLMDEESAALGRSMSARTEALETH
jgi:NAD(P)-dependent dehydrogenase (short-subunit alcohol dehydrogenase family)